MNEKNYNTMSSDELSNKLDYKYKWIRRIDNYLFPIKNKIDKLEVELLELKSIKRRGADIRGRLTKDDEMLSRHYWEAKKR